MALTYKGMVARIEYPPCELLLLVRTIRLRKLVPLPRVRAGSS